MNYKVELVPSGVPGARSTFYRGGIKFSLGEPKILDLTDEEAEVFKNDWRLKVSDSKDPGRTLKEEAARYSEEIPPSFGTIDPKTVASKAEAVENTDTTSKENVGSETAGTESVETLLKDYSRDELDDIATELGVENADELANKTEVAQAIVAAR